jgi:hypothetical protein
MYSRGNILHYYITLLLFILHIEIYPAWTVRVAHADIQYVLYIQIALSIDSGGHFTAAGYTYNTRKASCCNVCKNKKIQVNV